MKKITLALGCLLLTACALEPDLEPGLADECIHSAFDSAARCYEVGGSGCKKAFELRIKGCEIEGAVDVDLEEYVCPVCPENPVLEDEWTDICEEGWIGCRCKVGDRCLPDLTCSSGKICVPE